MGFNSGFKGLMITFPPSCFYGDPRSSLLLVEVSLEEPVTEVKMDYLH